jgi:hypothetical protein
MLTTPSFLAPSAKRFKRSAPVNAAKAAVVAAEGCAIKEPQEAAPNVAAPA